MNPSDYGQTGPSQEGRVPTPLQKINTYDFAWVLLSFLISMLWFRINQTPVFPIGFIGGLAIAYMIYKIDSELGKESYLNPSILLSIFGCAIGVFL